MARPTRLGRHRLNRLTWFERQELVIGPGPLPPGQVFPDDAARLAAWRQHRDVILAERPPNPTGPWAYWRFDGPADLGELADLYVLPDDAAGRTDKRQRQEALERRRATYLATRPTNGTTGHRTPVPAPMDYDNDQPGEG